MSFVSYLLIALFFWLQSAGDVFADGKAKRPDWSASKKSHKKPQKNCLEVKSPNEATALFDAVLDQPKTLSDSCLIGLAGIINPLAVEAQEVEFDRDGFLDQRDVKTILDGCGQDLCKGNKKHIAVAFLHSENEEGQAEIVTALDTIIEDRDLYESGEDADQIADQEYAEQQEQDKMLVLATREDGTLNNDPWWKKVGSQTYNHMKRTVQMHQTGTSDIGDENVNTSIFTILNKLTLGMFEMPIRVLINNGLSAIQTKVTQTAIQGTSAMTGGLAKGIFESGMCSAESCARQGMSEAAWCLFSEDADKKDQLYVRNDDGRHLNSNLSRSRHQQCAELLAQAIVELHEIRRQYGDAYKSTPDYKELIKRVPFIHHYTENQDFFHFAAYVAGGELADKYAGHLLNNEKALLAVEQKLRKAFRDPTYKKQMSYKADFESLNLGELDWSGIKITKDIRQVLQSSLDGMTDFLKILKEAEHNQKKKDPSKAAEIKTLEAEIASFKECQKLVNSGNHGQVMEQFNAARHKRDTHQANRKDTKAAIDPSTQGTYLGWRVCVLDVVLNSTLPGTENCKGQSGWSHEKRRTDAGHALASKKKAVETAKTQLKEAQAALKKAQDTLKKASKKDKAAKQKSLDAAKKNLDKAQKGLEASERSLKDSAFKAKEAEKCINVGLDLAKSKKANSVY